MPSQSAPTRRADRFEAYALAASLALIPPTCAVAGLAQRYGEASKALVVAIAVFAYAGLAWRACRESYAAAQRDDLSACAHHAAYPLSLCVAITAYDALIAQPYALGLAILA
jgi:hypothetical protein